MRLALVNEYRFREGSASSEAVTDPLGQIVARFGDRHNTFRHVVAGVDCLLETIRGSSPRLLQAEELEDEKLAR